MKRIMIICTLIIGTQTFAQENNDSFTDLSTFKLCNFAVVDLKKLDKDIELIDFNEKGYCLGNQSFTVGKGYISSKFPNVIFQNENDTERINKIHITPGFIGKLPNGTEVNLNELTSDDVVLMMPGLKMSTTGDCDEYNSLKDDNLRFYFASGEETDAVLIKGIDIVAECPPMASQNEVRNPIFFINDVESTQEQVGKLKPEEIKSFEVINPNDARKKYGEKGEFGVVLIKTKN